MEIDEDNLVVRRVGEDEKGNKEGIANPNRRMQVWELNYNGQDERRKDLTSGSVKLVTPPEKYFHGRPNQIARCPSSYIPTSNSVSHSRRRERRHSLCAELRGFRRTPNRVGTDSQWQGIRVEGPRTRRVVRIAGEASHCPGKRQNLPLSCPAYPPPLRYEVETEPPFVPCKRHRSWWSYQCRSRVRRGSTWHNKSYSFVETLTHLQFTATLCV